MVLANTKPDVRGTDNGIWRRLLLVLFGVSIAQKDVDKELLKKLEAELDGIFAWAVRGCTAWQRDGLGTHPAITRAVASYRREQDVVGEWVSERCVCVCQPTDQHWTDDGFCETCGAAVQLRLVVESEGPREPWSALYPDFKAWQEARGQPKPWSLPGLRAELVKRRGLTPYRTNAERGVMGIRLRYQPGAATDTRPDWSYKK